MPYADLIKRRAFARELQRKRHEFVVRAKAKPCMDCGIQYPSWVMQFDHRNPVEKLWTLARPHSRNFQKLQEEIDKCDVVCANCHAMRTHKRANGGTYAVQK